MQFNIEIKSPALMQKTVISKKDGKEYVIRNQSGWINLGKPYPQEVQIPVDLGTEPYAPGVYLVDPASFYVSQYGQLAMGRLKLIKNPTPK